MPLEASDLESSTNAAVRWRGGAIVVLEVGVDVGIVCSVYSNFQGRFRLSWDHIETWTVNIEHRSEFWT